jgi:hypothetical protein
LTTAATVVGAKDARFAGAKKVEVPDVAALVSDDGVEFCAIDLPGIADAENTGSKSETDFTALALKWASECDVVVWVTDARTAFLTTHETREFTDMRRALEKIAEEDGKLFQFCILLAKYETDEPGPIGSHRPLGRRGPRCRHKGARGRDHAAHGALDHRGPRGAHSRPFRPKALLGSGPARHRDRQI